MRVYDTLSDALEEIRRDVYKGSLLTSTRVQNKVDMDLETRERVGYSYGILGGWPNTHEELFDFGGQSGMPLFQGKFRKSMLEWLYWEEACRIDPKTQEKPTEVIHPLLKTVLEGQWPSYTYGERLYGALPTMYETLLTDPDSRRAFWPIFRTEDSRRAVAPTRTPCSLGYQAMIRKVNEKKVLMFFYLQRSSDFLDFWLTDIWLARRFQEYLAKKLEVEPGLLAHYIISFHMFMDDADEIY